MSIDQTGRFTDRADHYARFRPGYPSGIIRILERRIGFDEMDVVADMGSGTGLLTKLFLENGNKVFAVEPNLEMRSHAEKDLDLFAKFVSVSGTAENTTLPPRSVDLAVVGQALHWFDAAKALAELRRILKRRGNLCVVYNDRRQDGFGRAYGRVVKRNQRDRSKVPNPDDAYISGFFRKGKYYKFKVPNEQLLDFEGLLGRFLSASYLPSRNDKSFANLYEDVKKLFVEHSAKGHVKLRYNTTVYLGPVAERAQRMQRRMRKAPDDPSNRLFK